MAYSLVLRMYKCRHIEKKNGKLLLRIVLHTFSCAPTVWGCWAIVQRHSLEGTGGRSTIHSRCCKFSFHHCEKLFFFDHIVKPELLLKEACYLTSSLLVVWEHTAVVLKHSCLLPCCRVFCCRGPKASSQVESKGKMWSGFCGNPSRREAYVMHRGWSPLRLWSKH